MVDDPQLVQVLSGTHLPTSEGWKAELAQQREEVGRSGGMTSTGNRARVARMVAMFTHYTTAALTIKQNMKWKRLLTEYDLINLILS